MKVFNEFLQWTVIGLIVLFLFGIDFDFLAESPREIRDIETTNSTQNQRISSIERKIIKIESDLKEVATANDLQRVESSLQSIKSETKEISQNITKQSTSIVSAKTDQPKPVVVDEESNQLLALYSEHKLAINSLAVIIALLILMGWRKTYTLQKSRESRVPVTHLKTVNKSQSNERDCA